MQTTINIKSDIFSEISKAAGLRGMSSSAMIIELLKNVMHDSSNTATIGRLVQYQVREIQEEWHTFHISFREDDFEFFQDLRKLLKKSLSLILADAVKKYLGTLLKKGKNTDNYPHANYVIIKEMIDTIISWRLIWGFPPNIAQIIEQSNHPA
jgi:hypothetical protein